MKEIQFAVHGVRLLSRIITAAKFLQVQNNEQVRYCEIHLSLPQTVTLLRQRSWLIFPSSRDHKNSDQICSLAHYKWSLTRLQQIMEMLCLVPHAFPTSLHIGTEILLGKQSKLPFDIFIQLLCESLICEPLCYINESCMSEGMLWPQTTSIDSVPKSVHG